VFRGGWFLSSLFAFFGVCWRLILFRRACDQFPKAFFVVENHFAFHDAARQIKL
jgi:hypothetical protein